MKRNSTVHFPVLIPTVLIIVFATLSMILFPDTASIVVGKLFHVLTYDLGWVFLGIFILSMGFGLWLAYSRCGTLVFGGEGSPKDYSEFSWGAMLFTSGLGVGIVLMAFVEPMYSQFLWGIPGWLAYTPGIVAVGYFLYNRKSNVLRLSAVTEPLLGRRANGTLGVIMDVVVTAATVGGISTSLGLGVPTLTGVLTALTGWQESTQLTISILAVWMVVFALTMYLGLDKGIKKVSDFNMYLFAFFVVIVAVRSPLLQIVNLEFNSLGLMLDNLGKLLLSTDPFTQSGFPQNWTVFYWAWMLSFLPMMALFVDAPSGKPCSARASGAASAVCFPSPSLAATRCICSIPAQLILREFTPRRGATR